MTKETIQKSNRTAPKRQAPQESALVAALWARMEDNGENPEDLAAAIGITTQYLNLLLKGRSTEGMAREHIENAASYLKIPVAQALMLSGALASEDFMFLPSLEEKIERTRRVMKLDPLWTGFIPAPDEWEKTPLRSKVLIAMLYERAKTSLMGDVTPEEIEQADSDRSES